MPGGRHPVMKDCAWMSAHGKVRMGLQEIHLFLQFQRICPVIVSLAYRRIFSRDTGKGVNPVGYRPDPLLVENWFDDCRMCRGILRNRFSRTVCGCVIRNQEFKWKIRFLRQNAVQTLRDEAFLLTADDDYGKKWSSKKGCIDHQAIQYHYGGFPKQPGQ